MKMPCSNTEALRQYELAQDRPETPIDRDALIEKWFDKLIANPMLIESVILREAERKADEEMYER